MLGDRSICHIEKLFSLLAGNIVFQSICILKYRFAYVQEDTFATIFENGHNHDK